MTQTTINFDGIQNLTSLMNIITPEEDDIFHVYTLRYYYVDCNNAFTTEIVAESDEEAMSDAEHFLKFSNKGAEKKGLRKAGNFIKTVFVENHKWETIGCVHI